jgi:hypothetical protein
MQDMSELEEVLEKGVNEVLGRNFDLPPESLEKISKICRAALLLATEVVGVIAEIEVARHYQDLHNTKH